MKLYKLYFKKRSSKYYYIACELAKRAHKHTILNNMFENDTESINHEVVFREDQLIDLDLLYGVIMHDNMNEGIVGYDVYGVDLKYLLEHCRNKNYSRDHIKIIHFCGWQIKKENNVREFPKAKYIVEELKKRHGDNYDNHLGKLVSDYMFKIQEEFSITRIRIKQWNDWKFRKENPDELFPIEKFVRESKNLSEAWNKQHKAYCSYLREKRSEIDITEQVNEDRKLNMIIKNERKRVYDDIYKELILKKQVPLKWKSEGELFIFIVKYFPEALFQYSPDWLFPQSYDVYIPSLNVAIEYQGIQHYQAVDFFGGEESYKRRIELDQKKKELSLLNKVILIDWSYEESLSENKLIQKFEEKGITFFSDYNSLKDSTINNTEIIPVVGITRQERKPYVDKLKTNDLVNFERDYNNSYDSNAIKVLDEDANMLGYVAKDQAEIYAPKLDSGLKFKGIVLQKRPKVINIKLISIPIS